MGTCLQIKNQISIDKNLQHYKNRISLLYKHVTLEKDGHLPPNKKNQPSKDRNLQHYKTKISLLYKHVTLRMGTCLQINKSKINMNLQQNFFTLQTCDSKKDGHLPSN